MALKGRYDYIENQDVIVLEQKAIDYYKKKFPTLDVEKELHLIAHFFRNFPTQRVETKKELANKIELLLNKALKGNGINEEMMAKIVGKDYIPLLTYYKLCEVN